MSVHSLGLMTSSHSLISQKHMSRHQPEIPELPAAGHTERLEFALYLQSCFADRETEKYSCSGLFLPSKNGIPRSTDPLVPWAFPNLSRTRQESERREQVQNRDPQLFCRLSAALSGRCSLCSLRVWEFVSHSPYPHLPVQRAQRDLIRNPGV